ncbi:MAG: N-acetylmuramoyl-L-alanine amidase [Bauldia sp.]|nr:N-acetylmuramoyl-L-alanine amidase [Bauldia sp.]
MRTIPTGWMPPAAAKRIIVHWTAGAWKASAVDREHYHIMIEDDGNLVLGDRSIADNDSTADGRYAAHTRNCNTGSISVAVCAMAGAVERPFSAGKYPITAVQWATLAEVCAQLAKRYGIPVQRDRILSHAEVQPTLGIAQAGKWDIAVLPFDRSISGAIPVGDRLREMIRARLAAPSTPAPTPGRPDDPGAPDLSQRTGCRSVFRNLRESFGRKPG